uniref:Large ribosomal subunit protein mL53 n=1 Tax=Romanomermis culicivorax TaxID=13658 RepID=A0A915JLV3_ROMCU
MPHPAKPTKFTRTMWERIREGVESTRENRSTKLADQLTLQKFKKVSFKFDPFVPSTSCREFMCLAHQMKIRQTNPDCRLKPEVVNDRSEPIIEADFKDGRKLKLFTSNLNLVDILTTWQKYSSEGNVVKQA